MKLRPIGSPETDLVAQKGALPERHSLALVPVDYQFEPSLNEPHQRKIAW